MSNFEVFPPRNVKFYFLTMLKGKMFLINKKGSFCLLRNTPEEEEEQLCMAKQLSLGSIPSDNRQEKLNSGTRELTLKCKLKCYFKLMNNPLGVSPSKGKQGATRGKEKIF